MDSFKFKTADFEGPLELLLQLIEQRKLAVNQVSLAQVTDNYIAFLDQQTVREPAALAQFLVVASTLILIKSLSLLPGFKLSAEEKEEMTDLETRLRLLQLVRHQAKFLKIKFGTQVSFPREPGVTQVGTFAPGQNITPLNLLAKAKKLITSWPVEPSLPQVVMEKVISLDEMITGLANRLTAALSLTFSDFAGHYKDNKKNVIVGFLSLLELVKRGSVEVKQSGLFADINMASRGTTIPSLSK